MKHLLMLFMVFSSVVAKAQSEITCTLSQAGKSENSIQVKANPNRLTNDGLYSSKGLDVGADNYSFDLTLTKVARGVVLVDVIFYENNHVEDEVASYSWELKQKGRSVIQEPLTDSGATVMNFVCDYL
jgi:hypothetical protein